MMSRVTLISSLLAFSLFNYAQYQGWSMFSENAESQPVRATNSIGSSHGMRSYHK